jgi:hypothetical protein
MGSNEDSSKSKTPSVKLGWSFWMLMLLIAVSTRLFGLVVGLVAWGLWSLIAFAIRRCRA